MSIRAFACNGAAIPSLRRRFALYLFSCARYSTRTRVHDRGSISVHPGSRVSFGLDDAVHRPVFDPALVILVSATTVDLARAQFATTTLYHFLFVPLTLGLGPIVAVFQTLWRRTGDESWLRLTHFFGTLFLINFAIGVATGLVQEFQFGMNWSVYSKFVGNVFGAPLAIEGLAAFFLESTFLGLWIFGWDRLSPRLHLATLWIAVAGTWLSAYFILVANSFMQDPVGYKIENGQAVLTSVSALLSSRWAMWAFVHTILAGLTCGAAVVFGVCCWHFARGRNVELFRPAAKVALIVLVPVACFNMWFGSHFGILVTELQPMKISAAEAQWKDCQKCAFSLFQVGGFSESDPDAELLDRGAGAALVPLDRLVQRQGDRADRAEQPVRAAVREGQLPAAGRGDLLEHARHGLRRLDRGARVAGRRVPVLEAAAGAPQVVPLDRGGDELRAVRRHDVRLAADRARAPALDRAGAAQDLQRELAGGWDDVARHQPHGVRQPLRHPGRARRLADAALRGP